MQSKGTLGSIIAGVIAIFLVLICLFYLSFTFVQSHHEGKADQYAQNLAGDKNSSDYEAKFSQFRKHYIDSISNENVWMGYNYQQVQKWGVGLGLDLKGGMSVILQVSMPDILRAMKNSDKDESFEIALAQADSIVKATNNDDYVGVFVEQYRKLRPAADFSVVFDAASVKKGADDSEVVRTLKSEVKDRVDNSATNVLRNRIDAYGVVSPNIQVLQGKDGQILLELPGVKEHERMAELLQRSANLEFYTTFQNQFNGQVLAALQNLDQALAADTTFNGTGIFANSYAMGGNGAMVKGIGAYNPVVGYFAPADTAAVNKAITSAQARRILPQNLKLLWGRYPEKAGKTSYYPLYALKTNMGKAAMDGSTVIDAKSDFDPNRNMNVVSMQMNSEGARSWSTITGEQRGFPVAIVLDNQVYSAPNVNDQINGGRSEITGNFTVQEAQDLANVLKSGKMNAKVDIISNYVIGPSLGQQAIDSGIMSFVVAIVLLMILMIAYYGVIPGLVANAGLICNLFFTLGILASFQAVLTLSGIAGIVLALGMAVDANVLIFERAKEELRAGKNARTAISDGYSNAFSAIFDSNLTSIITGVILLLYGTGPIKGFATTLIIGIICSFFTAVYLTRIVFIVGAKKKAFERLTFTTSLSRKMFTDSHINFLGKRKVSFTIVLAVVAVMIVSFFTKGMNQGIDFSGGRNYIVKLDQDVDRQTIEDNLKEVFPGASTQVINIEGKNQIRVSTNYKIEDGTQAVEKEITDILYEQLNPFMATKLTPEQFSATDASRGIISQQKVGPTVADDMRNEAYIAVTLSLIAMFLYILIRFRNVAFSLGALAAVAFTAFTIVGFYSLFYGILPFAMEVDQTFIAAILTVIGYQINDTVVVFDRVRENTALYPKKDFYTVINESINSTLGRTVMTSCSTLLVLLAIFFLGAESIRSFVFAMIFGVIIGTLATIFVASPVAYLADSRRNKGAKAAVAAAKK